jgi:hypothetical protein
VLSLSSCPSTFWILSWNYSCSSKYSPISRMKLPTSGKIITTISSCQAPEDCTDQNIDILKPRELYEDSCPGKLSISMQILQSTFSIHPDLSVWIIMKVSADINYHHVLP